MAIIQFFRIDFLLWATLRHKSVDGNLETMEEPATLSDCFDVLFYLYVMHVLGSVNCNDILIADQATFIILSRTCTLVEREAFILASTL